jgi:hypothetical protein
MRLVCGVFTVLVGASSGALHPPCTLYSANNASYLAFDNSIQAANAGLNGLDVNGYFCPAGAGKVYDNSKKRPYVGQRLVSVYNISTDTGYMEYGTPDYFPAPDSSFSQTTGSNPCNCYNQPLMWAAMHLPLDNANAEGFVRYIQGKYPQTKSWDPASGSPCDYVELGYTWHISAADTDPVVLTIPPGPTETVVIAGNPASTATQSSNDGGPCGVVSLDPFQASGYALQSPFLRPGAMPISAYCTESAADDPYGFVEHVVRFNASSTASLQNAYVEDSFSSADPVPTTATDPPHFSGPTPPPPPSPDAEFWKYDPNRRMFLQTLLRHLAIVDFTCQCRMGAVAALVAFSGVFNPTQLYANYHSSEFAIALTKLAAKVDETSHFKAPNVEADPGYRPDHIRMACPLLWVAKWTCVAMITQRPATQGTSGTYCSHFNNVYAVTIQMLSISGSDATQCDGISHSVLRDDGVSTPLTRQLQQTALAMLLCYGENDALTNPIISSSGAVGTQSLSYSSEDCWPGDVSIRLWTRDVPPQSTAQPTNAPTSPPPTQPPFSCSDCGDGGSCRDGHCQSTCFDGGCTYFCDDNTGC